LLPDKPYDPINRRISILVMTKEAEERMNQSFEKDTAPVVEGAPAEAVLPAQPQIAAPPAPTVSPAQPAVR
jgi:chemotaxis protein MotB